jgi:hypothetical protein
VADWSTISSLATGGGTLVLAIATFASVRSANRSARVAETTLREQRRPVLVHSRLDDPMQKIMFGDGRWVRAEGGRAAVEHANGNVYLAISLRNVGSGIGVLLGWHVWPERQRALQDHVPVEEFRMTQRDLFIPPSDIGMWQGALRDADEEVHGQVADAVAQRNNFAIDLLYSDQVGEQRSVSRFSIAATGDGEAATWLASVIKHWNVDRSGN